MAREVSSVNRQTKTSKLTSIFKMGMEIEFYSGLPPSLQGKQLVWTFETSLNSLGIENIPPLRFVKKIPEGVNILVIKTPTHSIWSTIKRLDGY